MSTMVAVMVTTDGAAMAAAAEAVRQAEAAAWRVVHGMRRRGGTNPKRLDAAIQRASEATAARKMVEGMARDVSAAVAARNGVAA